MPPHSVSVSEEPMDLSVVIVSYNTRALLQACLAAIPRAATGLRTEIIVVDNGSADGSGAMVREMFPNVSLIESDNVGFGAGSNKGIAHSGGRYVLLLNPDTDAQDDAFVHMTRFMDETPRAGAVGARLVNSDGSFQHSAFRFPTLLMTFIDFFPINHRLLNSRFNGRYPRHADGNGPLQIDHPLGACLMVRRDVIDQVGVFDEGFFMYCEEIDWCLRIKRAGWQVWLQPAARVIHHGAQSTSQFRDRMFVELFRSRARFFAKHHSPLYCLANRWLVRLGLARELARAWRQRRRGQLEDEEYRSRVAAYRQVW